MNRIVVYENTDPLLSIRLKRRLPRGGTTAYPLGGVSEIEFVVKSDLDSAQVLFDYKLSDGEITIVDDGMAPNSRYSEIAIQCARGDLSTPRTLYFHIVVTRVGKRDAVMTGIFDILNI